MTPSPFWDDLVTAAVVGTERRPFHRLNAPDGFGQLVAGADLLTTATAAWAYQEAGSAFARRPGAHRPPAPEDDRPALPPATLRSFATIVSNLRFRGVLPEWLELAARRGEKLPAELVPDLLNATPLVARATASAVAGPVAPWLASYRPEWQWAAPLGGIDGDGANGRGFAGDRAGLRRLHLAWERKDEERLAALAAVRAANPRQAREFVIAVFAGEPAAFRARIVQTLSTALSGDDEAFLDHCLKDRSKDVREAAAALLVALPTSRYAQRLEAEVVPVVRIVGRLRARLTVAPDDRAARIPSVPLGAWSRHLGRPPEELARLAVRDTVLDALDGWKSAAAAQRDARWAKALLDAGVFPTPGLLATLPGGDAERTLVTVLDGPRLVEALSLLRSRPRPWSATLTQAALAAVRAAATQPARATFAVVQEVLPAMALAADPAQAPDAVALREELNQAPLRALWAQPLASLGVTMSFRFAMHEEFR